MSPLVAGVLRILSKFARAGVYMVRAGAGAVSTAPQDARREGERGTEVVVHTPPIALVCARTVGVATNEGAIGCMPTGLVRCFSESRQSGVRAQGGAAGGGGGSRGGVGDAPGRKEGKNGSLLVSVVEELQATRLLGSNELVALLQSLQSLRSRLGTSTTTSNFANITNNGMTCSHGNTNSNEIAGMSHVSGS